MSATTPNSSRRRDFAGSTSLLTAFFVLSGIASVTFFADRDHNEVGERAAKAAAARWQAAGCEAHIWRLREGLGDLNDARAE